MLDTSSSRSGPFEGIEAILVIHFGLCHDRRPLVVDPQWQASRGHRWAVVNARLNTS
jgi:hypothetical protein